MQIIYPTTIHDLERNFKLIEVFVPKGNRRKYRKTKETLKVLIDRIEGDYYISRSYRDAPEVDCEVLIPIKNDHLKIGQFYTVMVNDSEEYDLFAEISR